MRCCVLANKLIKSDQLIRVITRKPKSERVGRKIIKSKMKNILMLIMLVIVVTSCQEKEVVEFNEVSSKESSSLKQSQFKGDLESESYKFKVFESNSELAERLYEYSEKGNYTPLLLVYNLEEEIDLFTLNENGEIGIEDKIYRIDGDFVYTYTSSGEGKVDSFHKHVLSDEIEIEDKIFRIDGDFVYTYQVVDKDPLGKIEIEDNIFRIDGEFVY